VPDWAGKPQVTTHPLNRLGEKEVAAFIGQLTKTHQLPEAIIRQIIQRSDGIPLFVDELTRSVIEAETGPLDGDSEGSAALTVPATLQASLVARLDRLSLAKDIAQIGATIGRDFPYELLSLVTDVSASELDNALSHLTQSGLVSRRGEIPNAVYSFKHALVQEAAYQTLLRSRRQQLHSKIAQALETRFSETAGSRPELLAMHFWEAGQPERSVSYRLQAAQLSASHFANVEAIAHGTRGLFELRSLPLTEHRDRLELQFLTTLGPALVATRGYAADETIKAYERARELVNQSRDEKNWDVVLTGLFVAYYNRAAYRAGLDVGHEFLKRADSAVHRCVGHRMLAASYNSMGRFDESVVQGESAFSQYDPARHSDLAWRYAHDIGVAAATHWAIGAWHRGQLALADVMQKEALGIAQRLGHPNTLGYALYYDGALASLWRRDRESLTQFTSRLRDHAVRQGSPQWMAWVAPLEGLALAQQGQVEAGIEMVENGIANCDRIKNHAMRPIFLMCLADALQMAGRYERAEQVLVTALAISTETGERWADAEIYRLNGKIAFGCWRIAEREKGKAPLESELVDC
jgi:predicted ATPase